MRRVERFVASTLNGLGYTRAQPRRARLNSIYSKYQRYTMCSRESYTANLALVSTVDAPGCVIECGVWKGGSSAGMAEILGPDRDYFLFDSFQGHVEPQPIDGPAAFAWQADAGGLYYFNNGVTGPEDARRAMTMAGATSFTLVEGWFEDTLKDFVPPSPIAVLRIDCDWYEGTMTCLRALFPYLHEEGTLIADGYPDWDGYAHAIHRYLAEYEKPARIKQLDGLYYVVKGARVWDV
jgi:O-methyltransferase